jgi:hypothetical protein
VGCNAKIEEGEAEEEEEEEEEDIVMFYDIFRS